MANTEDGYVGHLRPEHTASRFNAEAFLIQTLIDRVSTATLCKVVAVTNNGGVEPVGFVDVVPLVSQLDGDGNAIPYTDPIYRVPYFRLRGGNSAVIIDPEVGDLGVAVFCERDISSAVANKGPANPGSARRYDKSDALYLGGFLSAAPAQYVQFSATGIRIHSPAAVKLEAPLVSITSSTLTHNGVNIGATHTHSGVNPGGGTSGPPV